MVALGNNWDRTNIPMSEYIKCISDDFLMYITKKLVHTDLKFLNQYLVIVTQLTSEA